MLRDELSDPVPYGGLVASGADVAVEHSMIADLGMASLRAGALSHPREAVANRRQIGPRRPRSRRWLGRFQSPATLDRRRRTSARSLPVVVIRLVSGIRHPPR